VGAALRPVASDAEEDVDLTLLEEVDHHGGVLASAGASQDGAAQVVDVLHEGLVEEPGLEAGLGVEALVAVADAQDAVNAVVLAELVVGGADHVVEAGRETSAGHQGRPGLRRVEEDPLARSRLLEEEFRPGARLRRHLDRGADARRVVDEAAVALQEQG
jgi:hypothetical protein